MSQDVPAFQALPGATPDNSAFIDLYFDPSTKGYPRRSRVSLVINGYQLWLGFGQSVALAVPAGPVSIVVQQIDQLLFSSRHGLTFLCMSVRGCRCSIGLPISSATRDH